MESYPTDPTYNYLANTIYFIHFKHKISYKIYAWVGDEISRQNSAISVSAVLYFTWCGMVWCGAYI